MPHRQHLRSMPLPETETQTAPRRRERRYTARGGTYGEPSRAHLVALILGTYAEMPALTLHLRQAAKLFGLRETTCRVVLDDLVEDGRLSLSADGRYRPMTRAEV